MYIRTRNAIAAVLTLAALAAAMHGCGGCVLVRPEGEAWYEYAGGTRSVASEDKP